jgi:diguanylate cyclase (GGDEF)-like protein
MARAAFETRMVVVGQTSDLRAVRFEISNHLDDPVIGALVVSGYDITELEAARQELEYLARHDPLTGLSTRAHLTRHLERLLQSEQPFVTLFIDLDRFKPVNDRWGHDAGDALLQAVAQRLLDSVGPGDLVARVGGDEFVIIAEHIGEPDEMRRLADRIETVISAPYDLAVGQIRIGACVGGTVAREGATVTSVLADADAAMYGRKATRRASSSARHRSTITRRPAST